MNTPDTTFHSLHLDERQRAMLKAMGVTHWWPTDTPLATPSTLAPTEPAPSTHAAAPPAQTSTPPRARTEGATSIATHAALTSTNGQIQSQKIPPIRPPRPPRPPASLASAQSPEPDGASTATFTPTPVTRDAVADMDWDTLTDTITHCQACGLCQGRQQAVPGTGQRQARWMVVGEAPGEQEDRHGLPFVGPAGQLLDAMLAAMRLSRESDVYIANVIKCRPPQNRNPAPAEVAQCQPYLRRQIALVQPGLILAMGRFAAQTLLAGVVPDVERLPLGKLRGQVYMAAGIPVVVTYHPAYLLRNPADKAKVWDDLCLAMHHAGHQPLVAGR